MWLGWGWRGQRFRSAREFRGSASSSTRPTGLVKARKVRSAHRRLRSRLAAYHAGEISFAELDASVQGWINHVAHADSWGLRGHILDTLPIRPAEHRRAKAARQFLAS